MGSLVGTKSFDNALLSFQEMAIIDPEMTCFSNADDNDALLLSLTKDFKGPNNGADNEDEVLLASVPYTEEFSAKRSDKVDDEDDVLLASVPYTEELSAKSSNEVDQALLSSRREPLKKPGAPTIKQPTNDYSTKLWEYPAGYHAHDESTELLWKGHLTKFKLTTFKRFS